MRPVPSARTHHKRRPVVGVVVDEERGVRIAAQVLEPPEAPRRLRLVVDGGVDRVGAQREAAGHEMRVTGRGHRREPADRGRGDAGASGRLVHDTLGRNDGSAAHDRELQAFVVLGLGGPARSVGLRPVRDRTARARTGRCMPCVPRRSCWRR